MSGLFLRAWSLAVGTFAPGSQTFVAGSQALIVSQNAQGYDLHMTFEIEAPDFETPNNATVRVFNLAPNVSQQIGGEYTGLILQAGYVNGPFAQVFSGTIRQVKRGKLNATDTYTDIYVGDGDTAYNFGIVNQSMELASPGAQAAAVAQSFAEHNVTTGAGLATSLAGGILPRGKVLFGMGRSVARDLGKTTLTQWSIQNGKLVFVKLDGVLPGQAIKLNALTGLINVPETTPNGLTVRSLLNPLIQVGGLVQINNADIAQAQVQALYGYPNYSSITLFPTLSADGIYKVLVHEMEGDTRGGPWYSKLTCLAAAAAGPVNPYLASGPTP